MSLLEHGSCFLRMAFQSCSARRWKCDAEEEYVLLWNTEASSLSFGYPVHLDQQQTFHTLTAVSTLNPYLAKAIDFTHTTALDNAKLTQAFPQPRQATSLSGDETKTPWKTDPGWLKGYFPKPKDGEHYICNRNKTVVTTISNRFICWPGQVRGWKSSLGTENERLLLLKLQVRTEGR